MTLHSGEIATSVSLPTVATGSDALPLCRHSLPPPSCYSFSASSSPNFVLYSPPCYLFLFSSFVFWTRPSLYPWLPLFPPLTIPSCPSFPPHLISQFILLICLLSPPCSVSPVNLQVVLPHPSSPFHFPSPSSFLPSLSPITDPIKHGEGHSRRRVTEVRREKRGRGRTGREWREFESQ